MTLINNNIDISHSRNFQNIKKRYFQYLIPCTLTAVAASLNEFVDSIIVANLLDTKALSVVNIASSAMFIFATIYTVLGVGGAAVYSVSRGNHERKKADDIFSLSMLLALLIGVALTIFGIVFSPWIAKLLGRGSGLEEALSSYLKVFFCSSAPIIVSYTFIMFLPATGHPALAAVINIVSNCVNLLFDFIFIKAFDMGVNGAALATVVGFSTGFAILIIFYCIKKDDVGKLHFSADIFKQFKIIFGTGIPSATTQTGYAIKVAFCNLYAAQYAGESGIVSFTVCMQILSIISVFMQGVFDTLFPFYGTLKGMNDKKGQKYIIKLSATILMAVSCLFLLLLQVRPQLLLSMYAIEAPELVSGAIVAIRIFSWLLPIRWLYIQLRNILSVIGMKWYSLAISLADGFVLLILFSVILCPQIGINGLWFALMLTSVVIAVSVFFINRIIVKRSNGKYKGFWLENGNSDIITNLTINGNLSNISEITSMIEKTCRQYKLKMSSSMLVALSVEEMCVIVKNNMNDSHETPIDILIQQQDNEIVLDFCSVGTPLNTVSNPDDGFDNFEMLNKISKDISYDYVLGMNITRIKMSV